MPPPVKGQKCHPCARNTVLPIFQEAIAPSRGGLRQRRRNPDAEPARVLIRHIKEHGSSVEPRAVPAVRQSVGEEIANSISHGVGFVGALAAVPFLIGAALRLSDAPDIVGVSVFAATLVLLYLASTLYHALPSPKAKPVLRVVDHGAVYLLIAGTYTPFALGPLRGPWGSLLFALVWSLALLGIVVTALGGLRYPRLTTGAYLALGWLGVVVIRVLWVPLPLPGLVC